MIHHSERCRWSPTSHHKQVGGFIGSDNLQLLCVQPSTSSHNLQLPHGCHGHHCRQSHESHGEHGGHGGHGEHSGHGGQDRTGQDRIKLIFKLDFPGGWQLSQFLRCFYLFYLVFQIPYFIIVISHLFCVLFPPMSTDQRKIFKVKFWHFKFLL